MLGVKFGREESEGENEVLEGIKFTRNDIAGFWNMSLDRNSMISIQFLEFQES